MFTGIANFISNLPKRYLALRPYALSWCVSRVWCLMALKLAADEVDNASETPIQSLDQFLIEQCLQSTESRFEAERCLYRLFIRSLID